MDWQYYDSVFTADSTNTLAFDSTTPGLVTALLLDDVKVVAVPLPATATLGIALIGCLGGFGAWRKLKDHQNALA